MSFSILALLLGGLLLLSIPLSGVMLLGGWKMRRLDLYGLAIAACILAMLPCHPAFLIGLPIGVWGLAVLMRPEVKAAFQATPHHRPTPPKPAPPEVVAGRLRVPSIGVLIAGALSAGLWAVGIAYSLFTAPAFIQRDWPLVWLAVGIALLSLLSVVGAVCMLRRRAYPLAVTGAVLAILPTSIAVLIGLPCGVWALAVLRRPEVRRAFP